jgi:hypothetical protein
MKEEKGEKWYQRVMWLVIAAIISAIVAAILAPIINGIRLAPSGPAHSAGPTSTSAPRPTTTPTSSSSATVPRLNSSYHGTYSGNSSQGPVDLQVDSQDQQGNISATMIFNSNSTINYLSFSCQGAVTRDEQMTLRCQLPNTDAAFSFSGSIYPDGHIEGTEKYNDGTIYQDILR